MNDWMNEWMNKWLIEWMNGSDGFVELRWQNKTEVVWEQLSQCH